MRDRVERAGCSDDARRSDAKPHAGFQAQLRMSDKTLAVLRVNLYLKKGCAPRTKRRGAYKLNGDDSGNRTVTAADEGKREAHRTDDFTGLGRKSRARQVVVHKIQLGICQGVVPGQTRKEQAVGVGIASKGGSGACQRITNEPSRRNEIG